MRGRRLRRFVRQNSLSLVFGVLFLAALVGQAFAGLAEFNNQQVADGLATVSLGEYVTSADFAVDVTENWQSEYLQFLLYVVLTVWLVQRGSPESKEPGTEGLETDQRQKVG
jgi:fluoride ion exporter CrcB/FEX